MKKKILLLLSTICLACFVVATAVGCGHSCEFNNKVASKEYLKNEAMCAVKPEYYYSCDCGKHGDETFFLGSAKGHKFINFIAHSDPTCTLNATLIASCENGCGETKIVEIENTIYDHVYTNYVSNDDATCQKNCTATATCDNLCGYTDTIIIPDSKAQHDFVDYVDNNDATCMNNETQTGECKYGCKTKDTRIIPNSTVEHLYTEYFTNYDATCYQDGTKTASCEYGCGNFDTVEDFGSIVDHKFTKYTSNGNATYDTDGTKTAYCDYNCLQSDTIIDEGSRLSLPQYSSDDYIDIVAYSTPTNANWDGYSNNPDGLIDRVFRDLKNAGFTGLQPLREGYLTTGGNLSAWREKANQDALKAMELCQKYGLKYMVRDWTFMGSFNINGTEHNNASSWRDYFGRGGTIESGLDEMFKMSSSQNVISHQSYAGHNLWDEPNISQMERLIPVIKKYKELVPNGDCYFNLLPCYANAEQLGGTYQEYIDYYCDYLAPLLGYICYDYYPYEIKNGLSKVLDTYLYNFQVVAEKAKDLGIEFRMYIQAGSFGGNSRECRGVEDYRHQMYTALAFGVRYFIYFGYGYGSSDDSLVNTRLQPTKKYFYAQQVNNEIHGIEDVMLNFNWQSTMYKNGSIFTSNSAFSYLTDFKDVIDSHPRIENYRVNQDTVVGCFKDGEGRDGFMFVNYANPAKKLNDKVTAKFNDASKLIVYELGERKVVDLLNSGEYTFTLLPGEGRFIIPIQ